MQDHMVIQYPVFSIAYIACAVCSRHVYTRHDKKLLTCSGLMKTALKSISRPTLFNVVIFFVEAYFNVICKLLKWWNKSVQ